MYREVAKEQLMPKNFVFYKPEEHQQIIDNLEKSKARAIICATGRNPSLAGGVYPFPLIEDGDFNIPSVYMTEEEGKRLLAYIGKQVTRKSISRRIPGAIDNATGVTILLIIAELLNDYSGNKQIEIVAFNGEDYYDVTGQMKYIIDNQGNFDNILLNINIYGAAYKDGKSTFSFFDLPYMINQKVLKIISKYPGIVEGV